MKIKPHHFLDIIKLYGSGIDEFKPDEKYGHDFYRIGNNILRNKQANLVLSIEGDDICKPCRFNKDGKCIDVLENNRSKNELNKLLDQKILEYLELKENSEITVTNFSILIKEKLISKIFSIYSEPAFSKEQTLARFKNLTDGLDRYIG